MEKGDIVISQDYGVATLALARNGFVMHPSGKQLHNGNIDLLMFERHVGREARKKNIRGARHKKRTSEDNEQFRVQFEQLIKSLR